MGRTIGRWRTQIVAWHRAHVSNGPTEAVNNLIKRVKRVSVRLQTVPQLQDPHSALRREAELGPAPHGHTPLKSEEPANPG